ncbi:MAG: ribose 5-phosphate isomerase B [Lachnospiraceae bacterium]|jgi:ribose 5-phosphate isomerase B|nr:ribose 5-phosphate isomerase B [Lachnospiraceae bacterium]
MKIAIANDHAAIELKQVVKKYLEEKGHSVDDFGADKNEGISYTVYGETVGEKVAAGEYDFGVLICGTGVGISIAANKVPGVRAGVCSEPTTARLVKEHNNANIIAFGARIVGEEVAKSILDAYMEAEFQGGRHAERVNMLTDIEKKYSK